MPFVRLFLISLFVCRGVAFAQAVSLSEKMANRVLALWPDSMAVKANRPAEWNYEQGVVLEGLAGLWKNTANAKYFRYLQQSIDFYVKVNGDIRTYRKGEFNIDHVKTGRTLLLLYKVTNDLKYFKAAKLLREQLRQHPRNTLGGFWHKQIYPNQMWLDGLYMAEPFYAEYAATFQESAAFDDIAKQFVLMEQKARDARTGLLYHGWDESKQQKWADSSTGTSPSFWGRAMGWYGMALADVLDYFPLHHPQRDTLVAILQRFALAIQRVQDPKTGLWYQVLDKAGAEGNYVEASASCMFTYALAKGARLGYLPMDCQQIAKKAYAGIQSNFVENRPDGTIDLKGTVSVAGLGGNPYRDGTYAYYLQEKVATNDPKGIGAFLLAANEMELVPTLALGKGKTVLLDHYFNHETRTDSSGITFPHHYVWNQEEQNGFSFFGHVFHKYGIHTIQSADEPTAGLLSKAQIYILVDPDGRKENPTPHLISEQHANIIFEWVKSGGVLLLFANDSGHAELKGLNLLGAKMGIWFTNECGNMVKGNAYETGAVEVPNGHPLFPSVAKIYLKEICTFHVTPPAKAVLTKGKDIVMVTARIGKGAVFAVGDPWLYNEYVDDRKIPAAEYQNYKAAEGLVRWAIQQTNAAK